jgi:membrane protein YdbS with pleckstrin-like domain
VIRRVIVYWAVATILLCAGYFIYANTVTPDVVPNSFSAITIVLLIVGGPSLAALFLLLLMGFILRYVRPDTATYIGPSWDFLIFPACLLVVVSMTLASAAAPNGLLTLLAYAVVILYLIAPAHAGWWIWRQSARGRNVALGIGYLAVWLLVIMVVVIFIRSGAWYSESTSHSAYIIDGLLLAIFVLFPIVSIVHLEQRASSPVIRLW